MATRFKTSTSPDRQSLQAAVNYHLEVTLAKGSLDVGPEDYQLALALAIREPVIRAMNATAERVHQRARRKSITCRWNS